MGQIKPSGNRNTGVIPKARPVKTADSKRMRDAYSVADEIVKSGAGERAADVLAALQVSGAISPASASEIADAVSVILALEKSGVPASKITRKNVRNLLREAEDSKKRV